MVTVHPPLWLDHDNKISRMASTNVAYDKQCIDVAVPEQITLLRSHSETTVMPHNPYPDNLRNTCQKGKNKLLLESLAM